MRVQRSSGETFAFSAIARLDSQVEIDNYRN